MPRPSDIVTEAKTWLGVGFRHMGRTRKGGVDCIGLVIMVARALGLSTYDTNCYARRPDFGFMRREFKREMRLIDREEATSGDVLVSFPQEGRAHCGILEVDERGQRWLIHSYEPIGGVIREPLQGKASEYTFAFRYRGT